MTVPFKLHSVETPIVHPSLAEISEAVSSLRRLTDRLGPYDELLALQLVASRLRLEEVFGDDDWATKNRCHDHEAK